MTDREAIDILCNLEVSYLFVEIEARSLAVRALQEREERKKGCALCNSGRLYENYCPWCGKQMNLEV